MLAPYACSRSSVMLWWAYEVQDESVMRLAVSLSGYFCRKHLYVLLSLHLPHSYIILLLL